MAVLPIIVIVCTTGIIRYMSKTWLSPGAFFGLCWSFFLIVPVIFTQDYRLDQVGLWYIAVFTMAIGAGSVVAFRHLPIDNSRILDPLIKTELKAIKTTFIIFNLISIVGIILLFSYATSTYSVGYYTNGWMSIPNLIAIDRYGGNLNYPFVIKYSLYFIYPANLIGGLIMGFSHGPVRMKLLWFTPLLLALLLGIIEGARSSILLGLVLFFSSWLSAFMYEKNKKTKNNLLLKLALGSGTFILIFTGFFILIQWLRQGMDTIIIDLLLSKIQAYFFGYLSAFTQWAGQLGQFEWKSGLTTFAGPFNLVGIMERPLGFYDPVNISNGISTNIFTAFRGLIVDFSISGSIALAFIFGFMVQLIFQKEIKQSLIHIIPISMFYAFTLYSPLISIFHYNSILFSWVAISIPILLSKNGSMAYNS
ncbi:MAG: oligosaccharide repeat unit polymerase [Candidatus Marinimicrobia bacterium]|nr:oligosaccharide repeat unit polymerase [Candidatus Neomarinimicrobiota bacterium]